MIPLSKLVPSPANVRKTGGAAGIDELAASIEAHGLLQNLQVRPAAKGRYEVVAGGRRLAAMNLLCKQKKLAKDFPVACHVLDEADDGEISLAENIVRLDMHPADQFTAFQALIEQGRGVEDIAARFGVSALIVRQRLKLACVSPALIGVYREDEMTLDQLMAFCVSDDHAAQEAAWFGQPQWNRDPRSIRAVLTATQIEAEDRRVRFVTLGAYLAAGGGLHRDLFHAGHEGYLTDPALLNRLVGERLDAAADKLRGEGWSWVEAMPLRDHAALSGFQRVRPISKPLDEAAQQRRNDLMDEYDDLTEEDGHDPEDVEVCGRVSTLLDEIYAIEESSKAWTPELLDMAGAVLSIDYDGSLLIDRGLVRAGDARRLRQTDSGEPAPKKPGLSAALVESLTAERTAALRAMLIDNQAVALASLCHALAPQVFYGAHLESPSCIDVRLTSRDLARSAEAYAHSRAGLLLSERHDAWVKRLPEDVAALFAWLLAQDTATLLDLLAFCAAHGVNAVQTKAERFERGRSTHADALAEALGFDMRDWWQPTKASYLGRVPKGLVLEAVSEGVTAQAAENLAGLKKDRLIEAAEGRLAGSGWLPGLLRSPTMANAEGEDMAEAA